MKLYVGAVSGNSWKARILLEQLGVPYEMIIVDMGKQEHKAKWFVDGINPRGQLPALEDDGRIYWDSAAIMVYLARKFDRQDWLPIDAAGMGEVMTWVAMAATEIQFGLQYARRGVTSGRWVIGTKDNLPQYYAFAGLALDAMERRLATHDWLALDRITIADVACFPYVYYADEAALSLEPYPGVRRWLARCQARPNWAVAVLEAAPAVKS